MLPLEILGVNSIPTASRHRSTGLYIACAVLTSFATGVPEWLIAADCNRNGVDDAADLLAGRGADCNGNGILDECDLGSFSLSLGRIGGSRLEYGLAEDMDRDGAPDLVGAVVNTTAAVLLNRGRLEFGLGVEVEGADTPAEALPIDLDGDGDLDTSAVAIDDSGGRKRVILLRFDGKDRVPIATDSSMTTVDLDGDGDRDVAVAVNADQVVRILKNDKRDGTFTFVGAFTVSGRPLGIVAGDFDKDGSSDIAVSNRDSGNISVLLNNGAGTLRSAQNYPVGPDLLSLTAGDFDGDGAVDLAVAVSGAHAVAVLRNDGRGQFLSPAYTAVGTHPSAVQAGDLDRDGDLDLVTANRESADLTILRNSGGVFQAVAFLAVTRSPHWLAIEDWDRDGDLDVAVGPEITLLSNDGFGNLGTSSGVPVGRDPVALVAGDFDRDGDLDVAVASNGSDTVSLLQNPGDARFAVVGQFAVGQGPVAIVAADLDGDSNLDLVTANFGSRDLTVLRSDAGMNFALTSNLAIGSGLNGVAAADFDGDRQIDLVAASRGETGVFFGGVWVLRNLGNMSFAEPVGQLGAIDSAAITTVDVDRDGDSDLIVATWNFPRIRLLRNVSGVGEIKFDAPSDLPVQSPAASIQAGDWDGDGFLDLATANQARNNVSILWGRGVGGFAPSVDLGIAAKPSGMVSGDVDGDGLVDFVVPSEAEPTQTTLTVLRNVGNRMFDPVRFAAAPSRSAIVGNFDVDQNLDLLVADRLGDRVLVVETIVNPPTGLDCNRNRVPDDCDIAQGATDCDHDGVLDLCEVLPQLAFAAMTNLPLGGSVSDVPISLLVADFNADLFPDLAVAYTDARSKYVGVLLSLSDGRFDVPQFYRDTSVLGSLVTGDINGDGRPDLVYSTEGAKGAGILTNAGDGSFVTTYLRLPVVSLFPTVALGDVDSDGDIDLIAEGGEDYAVFKNKGGGAWEPAIQGTTGGHLASLVLRDLDLDGYIDAIGADTEQSWVHVLRGDGKGTFTPVARLAGLRSPPVFVVGDFDGDGVPDIAAGSRLDRTIAIFRNKRGAISFTAWPALPVGGAPIGLAAADLDGDGLEDLVSVNRTTTGRIALEYGAIAVFRSLGQGRFDPAFVPPVGADGNAIAVADFDRDGRLELAVALLAKSVAVVWNRTLPVQEQDCDHTVVPDVCEIASGASGDCNADAVPDSCEEDCDGNRVPDACELSSGTGHDCNANAILDACDIASGAAGDCDRNGIPDACDLATGTLGDCNRDGVPDACDADCDGNGASDVCEVFSRVAPDCDGNGLPDSCDIAAGRLSDCDESGVPDTCEFASGALGDCNQDGVPDKCDVDCDGNGTSDLCEISSGVAKDCNGNGKIDSCDIRANTVRDCDGSGVPDACEIQSGAAQDCNSNAFLDSCDVASGRSPDADHDGVPDECNVRPFHRGDVDGNGLLEITDALRLFQVLFIAGGEFACNDAADSNNDRRLDLADGISILSFLFLGAADLPNPGPSPQPCGLDPDGPAARLGCKEYSQC